MKHTKKRYLLERIEQQQREQKRYAERVLTNINEMNKKQKNWVTQFISKGKRR